MGKVHGSLARAGKVKSQTPKVEPQEKPKTPKGRAYKRLLYTRRFVNVTMTGGKRKVRLSPSAQLCHVQASKWWLLLCGCYGVGRAPGSLFGVPLWSVCFIQPCVWAFRFA
ncbi:hypothetical protein KEM56_007022 [Ascosphaera pollenicola]|nr:hypothetical protein KEM56_007022 [Ascosphaera pollenicola]